MRLSPVDFQDKENEATSMFSDVQTTPDSGLPDNHRHMFFIDENSSKDSGVSLDCRVCQYAYVVHWCFFFLTLNCINDWFNTTLRMSWGLCFGSYISPFQKRHFVFVLSVWPSWKLLHPTLPSFYMGIPLNLPSLLITIDICISLQHFDRTIFWRHYCPFDLKYYLKKL